MLFVGTSIIHPSTEGVFLLCNILDLLIYSYKVNFNKKKNSQSKQKRYEIHRGNVKVSSMDRKLSKDVKLILENRM